MNHTESAGKMEVNGITEMFKRSQTLHQCKYSHYIGDGDSETYKALCEQLDSEIKQKKKILIILKKEWAQD